MVLCKGCCSKEVGIVIVQDDDIKGWKGSLGYDAQMLGGINMQD